MYLEEKMLCRVYSLETILMTEYSSFWDIIMLFMLVIVLLYTWTEIVILL